MPTVLEPLLSHYGLPYKLLPPIADSFETGQLVICGDAYNLWEDLEAFGCRDDVGRGRVAKHGWDFMTINKVVETFPGEILHAYSNEPWLLSKFISARRNEYAKEFGPVQHTHSCKEGADWAWPWAGHGTSALGAAIVGVGLGYERVVLAGIPLDDRHHNGEPPWRRCRFSSSEAAAPKGSLELENVYWRKARELAFGGRVKSLSGRTQLWLGDAMEWRDDQIGDRAIAGE